MGNRSSTKSSPPVVDDAVSLRLARAEDLGALVEIENRCFSADRMSRRSLQRFIGRDTASFLVAEIDGRVVGDALVLFHAGTSLARLYSLAVDPDFRRRGIAGRFLQEVERIARERDCVYMRLEVRVDDPATVRLYERAGYHTFDGVEEYYEDGMDALRMEKRILSLKPAARVEVPYYAQTLEFTCGPAALLMAMQALDPTIEASQSHELHIWREATTIFMTSGHGGCGPQGLALAADRRGFDVEMYITQDGPLFVDGVRNEAKREVIRIVHQDFMDEIANTRVRVRHEPLDVSQMIGKLAAGGVPLVLISSYQMCRQKAPHWVVLTGADERFVYAHDPEVDEDLHKTVTDMTNIPMRRDAFDRMARYGRAQLKAVVIVYKRGEMP